MTEMIAAESPIRANTVVIDVHQRYRRRKATNFTMLTLTGLLTLLALVPLFWIIGYVIYKGGQYINLDFFTQFPKPMGMAGGGVLSAIEGTIILTIIAGVFSIPFGILVAFYVAYRPNTLLGTVARFSTDVLSGVPSIVIGLFGYALMVKPMGYYSALAGGVALALIMLPTIVRTTEEMIKLVPPSLREGSLALGSSEWKTALSITLPATLNGIVTGFILGLARASGETAPLLFTALGNENFNVSRIITSSLANGHNIFQAIWAMLNQPVNSLPLTLWKYSQMPYVERVNQSWAVALVLMMIVLAANILARVWVGARARRLRG